MRHPFLVLRKVILPVAKFEQLRYVEPICLDETVIKVILPVAKFEQLRYNKVK